MTAGDSAPRARADLLPFYALCDTSASMRAEGGIDALNEVLTATRDAAALNPVVADRVRFGVISFSATATVVLPLCDLGVRDTLPRLSPDGLTSYAPAFELLRATIEQDVAQLVADGYRVLRPAAFFLTDGRPSDAGADWRTALARLRADDFPHRPDIVAFGLGDADDRVLSAIGNVAAYVAADTANGAAAIASFGAVLVESVVASGAAGGLRLPEEPPGEMVEAVGSDLRLAQKAGDA